MPTIGLPKYTTAAAVYASYAKAVPYVAPYRAVVTNIAYKPPLVVQPVYTPYVAPKPVYVPYVAPYVAPKPSNAAPSYDPFANLYTVQGWHQAEVQTGNRKLLDQAVRQVLTRIIRNHQLTLRRYESRSTSGCADMASRGHFAVVVAGGLGLGWRLTERVTGGAAAPRFRRSSAANVPAAV